jgi:hypothetical protein
VINLADVLRKSLEKEGLGAPKKDKGAKPSEERKSA